MPISYRDVELKRNQRFAEKIDRTKTIKAVIVDEQGLDSGSGSVWADQNARRVWVRELGTAGSSQCPCYNITPVIGLGVILGYEIGSNTREVLRTDKEFFGPTNPNGASYESPSNVDFRPGGRLQLWLASKLIEPLATYPATTGLSVNVVGGDYPYAGTRKTFAGQTGIALTQNPNPGEHWYAGLYLDSANALQVIYGASVVVATIPTEPAWPAGAFRLSVVRVNDTQTSITLALDTDTANDILDRRMAWSDEHGSGWPFAHVLTVSSTDPDAQYATLPLAIAAAAAGDVISLDAETYSLTAMETLADIGLTIEGRGPGATIITSNITNSTAFFINAANITFRNVTVIHTGAGTASGCFQVNASGFTLDNVIVEKTSGAPTTAYGVWIYAGTGHRFINGTKIVCTSGTTKYGIQNSLAAITLTLEGGTIAGDTFDIYGDQAGSSISIYGALLPHNTLSFAGVVERSGNVSFERATPNPIINGSFLIWQRGTSFAAIATGAFSADRWSYDKVGVAVHTISQSSDVPTVAQAGVLTPFSVLIDCTTIDATIAASDFVLYTQKIEGSNFLSLAQRQITVSFWVKATKTGVYCFSVRNGGADRSYVAEYTINVTDTWEYKTITVLPSPTAGTWNYTTGIGAYFSWTLAGGSTYHTTAGAWQTGNFIATANQVNATDSTANDFRLALIKIEPGSVATPFVMPDYEIELGRCLRYAYVMDASTNAADQGFGTRVGTTSIAINFQYPVPMRIAPTLAHNITGYTAGAPGTTTIAIINYNTGAFYTITGALTVSQTSPNKIYTALSFVAGTSWSGTTGDIATLRLGPGVIALLSAEF